MTLTDVVTIAAVVGGLLLNVAAVAYGYGKLTSVVVHLENRLVLAGTDIDRRLDRVLAALESITDQVNHHAARLVRLEERIRMRQHEVGEDSV